MGEVLIEDHIIECCLGEPVQLIFSHLGDEEGVLLELKDMTNMFDQVGSIVLDYNSVLKLGLLIKQWKEGNGYE